MVDRKIGRVANIRGVKAGLAKDASQERVFKVAKGYGKPYTGSIAIDQEVANLLNWLAEQQEISPELALKKAVATAAYLHDVTTEQGGRLLVQRRDDSIGEILLK
jgi:hypothetical protein